jgi:hypothetical protein
MRDNVFLNKELEILKLDMMELKKEKIEAPSKLYERVMKTIALILGVGGVVGILLGLINFFVWTVIQLSKMGIIK